MLRLGRGTRAVAEPPPRVHWGQVRSAEDDIRWEGLDANVLFSAAKTDGAIRRLLALLREAGHECWVDGFVVEEARRNLALKEPEGGASLVKLLARLHVASVQPINPALDAALPLPPKDRPVLAAAIRLRCEALITGDRRHFGAHYGKVVRGVTVHSPRSIAAFIA